MLPISKRHSLSSKLVLLYQNNSTSLHHIKQSDCQSQTNHLVYFQIKKRYAGKKADKAGKPIVDALAPKAPKASASIKKTKRFKRVS